MNDPYAVLGIATYADDAEIRRRYLELVREFSPDRHPERFALIREAFDHLRDPAKRLETQIFRWSSTDSIDAIAADVRSRLAVSKLPIDLLLSFSDIP
jgi:curved DNA-binding protein CbpA